MENLFIFTRGVGIGIILMLCFKAWLDFRHLLAGRLLFALMVTLGAYLVAPLLGSSSLFLSIAVTLATLVTAIFWLFSQSLFNDWDEKNIVIGPMRWATLGLFLVIAEADFWVAQAGGALDPALTQGLFYLAYTFRFVFIVLALNAILGQWRQDLVESRRRLRSVMAGMGGVYILAVTLAETYLGGREAPLWLELGHSMLLTLMMLVLAVWFLLLNPKGLFEGRNQSAETVESGGDPMSITTPITTPAPSLPPVEQQWLEALNNYIETECGYRNAELTIGSLGEDLSIPEHQLRKLINQHLGYRNFNDFLSRYRIAEAARRLADLEQARLPILSIALDVGYASVTPFNRAFKGLHQITPSEYRRRHQTR